MGKVLGILVVISIVASWVRSVVPAGLVELVGESAPVAVAVLAVLGALVWFGRSRATTTGAMRIGHSHGGTSQFIGRHEAGHYHVAKRLGFGGLTVYADRHGGYVDASRVPNDPVKRIATFRAGEYAVGSRAGCGYDRDSVKRVLRTVPAADRARVLREGEALGRRTVRSCRGAIRRDGRIIAERGTL